MSADHFNIGSTRQVIHPRGVLSRAGVLLWFSLAGALLLAFGTKPVQAQAPGLLWSTNVGAKLFALDAQTNAYAYFGGSVIKISGDGVPLQTNAICPKPGIARRDDAGNYYFGGNFDGSQDFGGITLVGGWTNAPPGPPHWSPGWPTCFLAKYAGNGALQWVVSFGGQSISNYVTDVLVDAGGAVYVGYVKANINSEGTLVRIGNSGTVLWEQTAIPYYYCGAVKLGGLTASNCCFLMYRWSSPPNITSGRVDTAGNHYRLGQLPLQMRSDADQNGVPVIDDLAQTLVVGRCFDNADMNCSAQVLRKYGASTSEIWTRTIPTNAHWTLARDAQQNVYLAGTNGMFAKFDNDGFFVWSNNFSRTVVSMVVDASGNRFVSSADGGVARVANEPAPQLPAITFAPQPQTVFLGDPVSFSVSATGTLPFKYIWRLNGTQVAGATDSAYLIAGAVLSNAGNYTVIVSNVAGAVTSTPALLRVKQVELYLGSQMLTNGTYVFVSPPTLSIHSAFASGSSFYTLDGSVPSFASTFYSGPFVVPTSATVRAIGYSADFSQSEEADTLNVIVLENHTLSASSSGGGSVSLNPPGGTYVSTNTVTATAIPSAGYQFLYWLGDVSGTNPAANVSMERDKAIYAEFGTTLSTTVAGSGHIELSPPGGRYAYGTVVRLTGVPDPRNYFGFWGNAATGNTNPLYFTIAAPTQTVSSIFAAVPAGQAALTVLITGHGRVNVNPRANVYPLNTSVSLTAVPDPAQNFINWSGDASATANPLTISMTQDRVITANFSGRPFLRANRSGIEGLTSQGFRLTVINDPPSVCQIYGSTDLSSWGWLGTATNNSVETQFLDPSATNAPKRFYKATP